MNVSRPSEWRYWPQSTQPCIATGFVLSLVGGTNDGKIVMIFIDRARPTFITGESASTSSTRITALTQLFSYVESNGTDGTDGWLFRRW